RAKRGCVDFCGANSDEHDSTLYVTVPTINEMGALAPSAFARAHSGRWPDCPHPEVQLWHGYCPAWALYRNRCTFGAANQPDFLITLAFMIDISQIETYDTLY
ncbi:MAG: hypothetical protein KDE28_03175, partial [Anaerolineales bacterium]|nr:hypothetical protein [Anaerolineales bacterium]